MKSPASRRRRSWPTIVAVAATAALLAAGLIVAGYLALPALATRRLPVEQIRRLGFTDFTGHVSRIGPYQTMAGPFVFGPTRRPALSVQTVALRYTPGELRRKKIRAIRIGDVTVNATLGPDGFVLPGFNPGALPEKARVDRSVTSASSPLSDMRVDQIEIRGGMFNLAWRDAVYKIPFEADLKPVGKDMTRLDVNVRLFVRGQPLTLTATVDTNDRVADVTLDAPLLALDRFADLVHLIPGLDASGRIDLQAGARVGMSPFTLSGEAELSILSFEIEHPVPGALKAGVVLPMEFAFSQNGLDGWTAEIGTRESDPIDPGGTLDLTVAAGDIQTGMPRFRLTVRGDRQGGDAQWHLDLDTIRADAAGAVVGLPSARAEGRMHFTREPLGSDWVGDTRIQLFHTTLEGSGISGEIDALTLSVRFQRQGDDATLVDTRLRLDNGRFDHPSSGLRLVGVSLDLPIASGREATDGEATFSIAHVFYHEHLLGRIHGQGSQKKSVYAFNAIHTSDRFQGMTAAVTGTVLVDGFRFGDADLVFRIPPYELPPKNDLGALVPAVNGLVLSGVMSARGRLSSSRKGLQGSLEIEVADGSLAMAARQIEVTGIQATLHFPELPRLRSGPAQSIRFSRAAMGAIVVDGGDFEIQVESDKTLLVEKGRLSWCGGRVDTGALRITAGRQDYQVSLYCQRLELSRILEQLGSVNARGSGTVNGRIPIGYRDGNLRFDDGFLFSTPGETGQIQLTGTEFLTRGIPVGTPQFTQVELAQEALKDYAYTWAKLGLTSEGEEFVMHLQFDGRPANPLPFVYKKEIGGFVRIKAGADGSVFQGIGLDVNLRLPLNRLLQYKDILNRIE